MTSSKTKQKNTLKEIYHEMKQRIRIILHLLGKLSPNELNPLPDEKSFQTISHLIKSIMETSQFERNGQYRDSIEEVLKWINLAFQKNYLTKYASSYPNPLFAVKKGAEILHSFLHRDLRRHQLSSEEHEIYRNYMLLINNLPDPSKSELAQNDAENMIDDLLKSS